MTPRIRHPGFDLNHTGSRLIKRGRQDPLIQRKKTRWRFDFNHTHDAFNQTARHRGGIRRGSTFFSVRPTELWDAPDVL